MDVPSPVVLAVELGGAAGVAGSGVWPVACATIRAIRPTIAAVSLWAIGVPDAVLTLPRTCWSNPGIAGAMTGASCLINPPQSTAGAGLAAAGGPAGGVAVSGMRIPLMISAMMLPQSG